MASSNIKLFDENKGNMLTDTEFSISNQRMNGLQTGVASSQLQNKAMYQASLVAYAIAQVMMQNGLNANDTDAVSAFVANLSGTMLQKVYDIATTAEAQAGVATGKWISPALVKAAIDYKLANPVVFGSTVTLARDPTENFQAATKQYVDNNNKLVFEEVVSNLRVNDSATDFLYKFRNTGKLEGCIGLALDFNIVYSAGDGSSASRFYFQASGGDFSSGALDIVSRTYISNAANENSKRLFLPGTNGTFSYSKFYYLRSGHGSSLSYGYTIVNKAYLVKLRL